MGAEHLLSFLRNEVSELDDENNIIYTSFQQNEEYERGIIDFAVVLKWVEKMNPYVKYNIVETTSTLLEITPAPGVQKFIVVIYNKTGHMGVYYNNGKTIEQLETTVFQKTTNNCSLYSGIILIVRPLLNSMSEMVELLYSILDLEGSVSCDKLAQISNYYFGRDKSWFCYRFGKVAPSILPITRDADIKGDKTLYIYFYGLCPAGIAYCYDTTRHFQQMKGQDFRIYQRAVGLPRKEVFYFAPWFQIIKHKYNKFVFIGHSYGSSFANHFAQFVIDNDPQIKKEDVISVSLDGSELIDTCEYVAYRFLKIPEDKKIKYNEFNAICDGRDIIREWFEKLGEHVKHSFGENIIECSAIDWYEAAKTCHSFENNHKHIIFNFYPNKKEPDVLTVKKKTDTVMRYTIYDMNYGNEYNHSMFQNKNVSEEIMRIIEEERKY